MVGVELYCTKCNRFELLTETAYALGSGRHWACGTIMVPSGSMIAAWTRLRFAIRELFSALKASFGVRR